MAKELTAESQLRRLTNYVDQCYRDRTPCNTGLIHTALRDLTLRLAENTVKVEH